MAIRFSFENAQSKPWCSSITRLAFVLLLLSFRGLSVAQNVEFVDNTDPRIRYSHSWFNVAGPNQYGGSVMLARDADAAAELTFQGIGISVFGTQGTSGGNITRSTYSVDLAPISEYVVPPNLQQLQFQVRFYQSPVLPDGNHTLVITNRNPNSFYWLDYLEITSAGSQTVPTSTQDPSSSLGPGVFNPESQQATPLIAESSVIPTPSLSDDSQISQTVPVTGTSGTLSGTADGGTQSAVADSSSGQSSSHSAVSPGAAAGIAISSIILVSGGVFAVWLRTRRRYDEKSGNVEARNIEPFDPNSGPRGPVIQGATTPYMVEHFPGPGVTPSPPLLLSEKQPIVTSSQPSHLLDYEHHGPGLPPGAGTPRLQADPDMYPSFSSTIENQLRLNPQVQSTGISTNHATMGSRRSTGAGAQLAGDPMAMASWSEQRQQQRPAASRPRLVVLS